MWSVVLGFVWSFPVFTDFRSFGYDHTEYSDVFISFLMFGTWMFFCLSFVVIWHVEYSRVEHARSDVI